MHFYLQLQSVVAALAAPWLGHTADTLTWSTQRFFRFCRVGTHARGPLFIIARRPYQLRGLLTFLVNGSIEFSPESAWPFEVVVCGVWCALHSLLLTVRLDRCVQRHGWGGSFLLGGLLFVNENGRTAVLLLVLAGHSPGFFCRSILIRVPMRNK